jgi:hypothetical protein
LENAPYNRRPPSPCFEIAKNNKEKKKKKKQKPIRFQ